MEITKTKLAVVMATFALGLIYTLPNFYPDQPILTINQPSQEDRSTIHMLIEQKAINTKQSAIESNEQMTLSFNNTEEQIQAKSLIEQHLKNKNTTLDLNLTSTVPEFFSWFQASPMKLGLDLRGGVNLLLAVDTSSHQQSNQSHFALQLLKSMRDEDIDYSEANIASDHIDLIAESKDQLYEMKKWLNSKGSHLQIIEDKSDPLLLKVQQHHRINSMQTEYLMKKSIESIQNRVNELGLSEAIVTKQGEKFISVDLPGIQDMQKAKALLGNTSSLRFHIVKKIHSPGSLTDKQKDNEQFVHGENDVVYELEQEPLLTGEAITYAVATVHENKPTIEVKLGTEASSRFYQKTLKNRGRALAIVLAQKELDAVEKKYHLKQTVISAPVIQDGLKHAFVITGMKNSEEAGNLALLLRSGSLAAPVEIVSQTTMGPSLGADNIQKGVYSIIGGLVIVMVFMSVYYRVFGIVANIALVLNMFLMVAMLSIMGATMTLPAMAALVLSVGMAVDANVLINERIREELRKGLSDTQAAFLGYEKAMSSIIDANVTTFIVALVLYLFSSGLIKGFAITLMIGLISAVYTSVYVTRLITLLILPRIRSLKEAVGV